jgi:pyruvate/2-oxoglutarate dehydrogenase complex dihydrolipoamide dehydrogenase (E3) component
MSISFPSASRKLLNCSKQRFADEEIAVLNGRKIERVASENGEIALYTDRKERIVSDRLLVGAGRKVDLSSLNLEAAGIAHTKRGITVDRYLRTNRRSTSLPSATATAITCSHMPRCIRG